MPEMPEMEGLAVRLSEMLAGARLTKAEVLGFSALKTFDIQPRDIEGRELQDVTRRGKYLIFRFGDVNMLLHLSQGGRVHLEEKPKTTKPKGAVLRLIF